MRIVNRRPLPLLLTVALLMTGCLSARPTTVESLAPAAALRLTSDHGFTVHPVSDTGGTGVGCVLRRLDGRVRARRADTLYVTNAYAVAHESAPGCAVGGNAAVAMATLSGVRVETSAVDIRKTARFIFLAGLSVALILGSFATPGG